MREDFVQRRSHRRGEGLEDLGRGVRTWELQGVATPFVGAGATAILAPPCTVEEHTNGPLDRRGGKRHALGMEGRERTLDGDAQRRGVEAKREGRVAHQGGRRQLRKNKPGSIAENALPEPRVSTKAIEAARQRLQLRQRERGDDVRAAHRRTSGLAARGCTE